LGRLRGRLLRVAGLGFAISLGYALDTVGQVRSPLFVGIVLSATALGLVAPILKDAGESEGEFGQLVALLSSASTMVRVVLATWNIHSTKYALMISSISVFSSLST